MGNTLCARYTCAVRYTVSAVCVTPLRTSGSSGDPETVLRDRDGCALVQGASLAGALRDWLGNTYPALEEPLFGSQRTAGRLIISDARFQDGTRVELRPRLRINGATGCAEDGGKYDVAHAAAGSEMTFTIHYLGTDPDCAETGAVEQMLAALHSGEIRLGAQRTNGFGQVRLTVHRRIFRMEDAGDRRDWLTDSGNAGQLLPLKETARRAYTRFTVSGRTDSLLVRSASSRQTENGSVTENLMENDVAILPGSSIRGAVRNRVQMIARFLHLPGDTVDTLFGRGAAGRETSGGALKDNGLAGRIRFSDARMNPAAQPITRIRIDRFTGGVIRGGLFQEAPVSGQVTLQIAVPAEDPLACGLLSYALRDLGLGLYHLGSGQAIGRGLIHVETITAVTPEGQRMKLQFREGTCSVTEGQALLTQWLAQVNAARSPDSVGRDVP